MYIDSIDIKRFRIFKSTNIRLVHPDATPESLGFAKPKLANINLVLGTNGQGKTTLLRAIALAALGPAVMSSGIYPYRLVRREPDVKQTKGKKGKRKLMGIERFASLVASLVPHPQDNAGTKPIRSTLGLQRIRDVEVFQIDDETADERWDAVFSSKSSAFFVVAYPSTRRVETREAFDPGSRRKSSSPRAQRVIGLFQDYSLVPLSTWLPAMQSRNPGRYKQVVGLVNRLLVETGYSFTGKLDNGEYVFERGGLGVPFPALSDGYQAFLGWIGDLLFHICETAPRGKKLVENRGIVLIDEVDLHLHPLWQMTILQTLSRELPALQFIVTSHSPLLVGGLEWMNVIVAKPGENQTSKLERIETSVNGLDADQILLTPFFGLESTRAPGAQRRIKALALRAQAGNANAALELMTLMAGDK